MNLITPSIIKINYRFKVNFIIIFSPPGFFIAWFLSLSVILPVIHWLNHKLIQCAALTLAIKKSGGEKNQISGLFWDKISP